MKNIELMREYMRLVEAGEEEPWKHFEVYLLNLNQWIEMESSDWFTECDFEFRSKPKTININGFEVPEPIREALKSGEKYYIADIYEINPYISARWFNDESDVDLLNRGIIHRTKEAASKHAEALLSFTKEAINDA